MAITLYTSAPAYGLPDLSPFVMKAELLLKMTGLPDAIDTSCFRTAPKGKLPHLCDGQAVVADSTFIRWHLERSHGIDFYKGCESQERALGWAFEKMLEDQFYRAPVDDRSLNDTNFESGWPASSVQRPRRLGP